MMPSQTGSMSGIFKSAGATIGTTTKMISKASITKPSRNIASITASTAPLTPPGKSMSARCTMSSPPSARNTRLNRVAPIRIRKIMLCICVVFSTTGISTPLSCVLRAARMIAPTAPTEAASVGAFGAIILAARKTQLSGVLMPVVEKTTQITSMIFLILIGATLFSLVFRALGGDDMVHRALSNLPGGVRGAVLAVMLAMFLLGFVMDAFEIIFVVVPIVAPALLTMPGVDPVWLGIMMAVNLQTSYMHPPLGPTLFYLRGVAPPEITTRHIYVGIIPFVLIQLFALVVLWSVPGLATMLPHALYGR